jgi:hypothetical protein
MEERMVKFLALLLLASPVFAQEIYMHGSFPPKDAKDIEIVVSDGWKQERVEKVAGSAHPMEGMKLSYKGEHGKEHSVWIIFSLEGQEN